MTGNQITIDVNGRAVNGHLALPPDGSGPGLLVLHAWWGLNPFFQQLCDRLAEQGFVVLAPDMHEGQVATTRDEAQALVNASDEQRVGDIAMAGRDFLRAHAAVRGERIGVIGFSFGAAWAMVVAAKDPDQVGATVLFYGTYPIDFSAVTSKVLGHFSPEDEWEPYDQIQAWERDLKASGVDVTFHFYPGTKHWFVEEDRPEYDAAAARLAWERTFAFLRENL
jgi:carboxymethylenebutenolidase